MAYTNETSNKLFNFLHEEMAYDADVCIAVVSIFSEDDEQYMNLSANNLEQVRGMLIVLATQALAEVQTINNMLVSS